MVASVCITLEVHLVNCSLKEGVAWINVSIPTSVYATACCAALRLGLNRKLTTAALRASVVLELVVEVQVDGVVRVGGVTGASDDSAGPLFLD